GRRSCGGDPQTAGVRGPARGERAGRPRDIWDLLVDKPGPVSDRAAEAEGRGLAGEHRAHVFGTCGGPNARWSEPVLPASGDQADRGHPWVASGDDSTARAHGRGDGRTGDTAPRGAGDRTTTSLHGQDR